MNDQRDILLQILSKVNQGHKSTLTVDGIKNGRSWMFGGSFAGTQDGPCANWKKPGGRRW